MDEKNVYLMISKTGTGFGKCIRLIGRQVYNHASISLDSNLDRTFGYARPQVRAYFLSGLVRESLYRYTTKKNISVPVVIFKVKVSKEKYDQIKKIIYDMLDNPEYKYNLFSVITFPILKGFSVYHTFSCIEFIAYLMEGTGYMSEKEGCKYTPDDLYEIFKDNIVYEGDIRGIMSGRYHEDRYFKSLNTRQCKNSILSLIEISKRTICRRSKRYSTT